VQADLMAALMDAGASGRGWRNELTSDVNQPMANTTDFVKLLVNHFKQFRVAFLKMGKAKISNQICQQKAWYLDVTASADPWNPARPSCALEEGYPSNNHAPAAWVSHEAQCSRVRLD
jgi:hypothetical protein